jgi:hypothetical protein
MTNTSNAASILPFLPNPSDPAIELLATYRDIAESLRRIADALTPTAPDLVGTPYVAKHAGRTTTRVTQWVQSGNFPLTASTPAGTASLTGSTAATSKSGFKPVEGRNS